MINFNINRDIFLSEYQNSRPFFQKKSFDFSITDEQIDEIILRSDVLDDDFKLNYKGKVLPKEKYIDGFQDIGKFRYKLNKAAFVSYMRNGATVIANKIYNEPLIYKFHNEVEKYTGRPALSSLYISYGGYNDSSFRSHWDTRDVFVMQLKGKKLWRLHKPNYELPLPTQQSKDMEHIVTCPKTNPDFEFLLEEGDLLYVPRGWWHDPVPCGERTVHLSVGTYGVYRNDFLIWLINEELPNHLESRKYLNSFNSHDNLEDYAELIKQLLLDKNLLKKFNVQHALKHFRSNDNLHINSLCNPSVNKLDLDKQISLNLFHKVEDLNSDLIANGILLKVDKRPDMEKIIKFIVNHSNVKVEEILSEFSYLDVEYVQDMLFKLACYDFIKVN
ncbi:JmjC domain-containing protein [Acinetobacter sp.]|uniref:JmjC domain-containing protein n=1 Tax=Acinetobacter sp. TaxID=472 RepID=UPI00388F295E